MTQLNNVVDPFGEVNVYPASSGKVRVTATILMEPNKEGSQTGIALDGSYSMEELYGGEQPASGGFLGGLFGGGKKQTKANEITPVAQDVCEYLARKIDADGGTTCIYWACGPGGTQIEEIGDLTADEAKSHVFGPPKKFGTGTQLLPAVRHFAEKFADAPWGFYVFITDGALHDLTEVKRFTKTLAQEISAGKRKPLKLILIGVGPDVDERQMEELDDLETGTDVDIWDHKLAADLRVLTQIFAEVVDKNARVSDNGKILDPSGNVVKNYSDTGLPAFIEFEIDANAEHFVLDVEGQQIQQSLR
ncbi:MAG: VWA domain-containing protein [Gemmataceae bacterium]